MLQLTQAIMTRRYPREDVRRKQFDFEDKLNSLIPIAAISTNSPMQPNQNQPRFIMAVPGKTLSVSDVATQFMIQALGSEKSPRASDLSSSSTYLDIALSEIFGAQKRWFSGVSLIFQQKEQMDGLWSQASLYESLISSRVKSVRQVLTLGINVVFDRSGLDVSFNIAQARTFTRNVPVLGLQGLQVDGDFDTPTDKIIQIKIDLTNKRGLDKPPSGSNLHQITSNIEGAIRDDIASWLGQARSKALLEALAG